MSETGLEIWLIISMIFILYAAFILIKSIKKHLLSTMRISQLGQQEFDARKSARAVMHRLITQASIMVLGVVFNTLSAFVYTADTTDGAIGYAVCSIIACGTLPFVSIIASSVLYGIIDLQTRRVSSRRVPNSSNSSKKKLIVQPSKKSRGTSTLTSNASVRQPAQSHSSSKA